MHGRGANVELIDRSVGNLHDGDGDLCAVLESDADEFAFFMTKKRRPNW